MQLCAGECRHIQKNHIERDRAGYHDSKCCQYLPEMREERCAKYSLLPYASPRSEKSRCLVDTAADVKPERSDQQTEQERHAPTPAVDCVGRKNACDKCTQQRASKNRQTLTDHLPGAIEAS